MQPEVLVSESEETTLETNTITSELANLLEALRKTYFSGQMHSTRSTTASSESVKRAILAGLGREKRFAQDLIRDLAVMSAGTWQPEEAAIRSQLEELNSSDLVSFEIVDERKLYAITKLGEKWLLNAAKSESKTSEPDGEKNGYLIEKKELLSSAVALAQATSAAMTNGSVEQFKTASHAIRSATKEIYAALGKQD